MAVETILGLVALVVVPLVSSEVCYYGNEPDPSHGNKLRWVLPVRDPCRCTVIRIGGMNSVTPKRAFQPKYEDQPFTTKDVTEIRKKFNCSDVTQPTNPADCQAIKESGQGMSDMYTIYPSQYSNGIDVYCNNGWMVFQRRVDGTVSFTRSWAEYRDGFGDKEGSFWLGNEILRRLTEPVAGEQGWQMSVRLTTNDGRQQYGVYNDFRVDGENYTLHVGEFQADPDNPLADCLSPPPGGEPPSNGQPFTTYDQDNDAEPDLNCADELKGGWWFNRCTETGWGVGRHSNLNGEYSQIPPADKYGRGIVWSTIYHQITRTVMKIRRRDG
ncbi:fibrinogen-like protein 1 [Asterias rubens]|uniref:fibrinogen-like protein 1 n=1 Tax=Asterias rubens TaxID=7604 RepID=UPI001454EA73|nr:fibrinogen-like protein 1 [Asterias rubens]